jgi:hypothetical protein
MSATVSTLWKVAAQQAEKDSAKPEAQNPLPELTVEEQLLAAGWLPIHASPFWKSPKGSMFPCASYALEQLQRQRELDAKRLPTVRIFVESAKCFYVCTPEEQL